MSMWTAIALISITCIIAGIFTDKGKKQNNKGMTDKLNAIHAKLDTLENDLRDRVETLERIVTNPHEDLKRQFDHLEKVS